MPARRAFVALFFPVPAASAYEQVRAAFRQKPRTWLVTGCAGFIGSHLLENLLQLDQSVIGIDNFATSKRANLDEVQALVTSKQWERCRFVAGDICDLETCRALFSNAGRKVDFVLHQAALGSVPRSIDDPINSNASNITGFLHMLVASRDARVQRFIYAASSSTYGDHPALPKVEEQIGRPLSPYAVTKYVNELYADVFARCYGMETIGLRYFNVFGPRQDPEGAYAAVIPKWIAGMLNREPVYINGDGETSRDFCYVSNVVQANLLAALTSKAEALNQVYNIALGERTTLNELFALLTAGLARVRDAPLTATPTHREPRPGDVRHSQADISKARRLLDYEPTHGVKAGLEEAMAWYVDTLGRAPGG